MDFHSMSLWYKFLWVFTFTCLVVNLCYPSVAATMGAWLSYRAGAPRGQIVYSLLGSWEEDGLVLLWPPVFFVMGIATLLVGTGVWR